MERPVVDLHLFPFITSCLPHPGGNTFFLEVAHPFAYRTCPVFICACLTTGDVQDASFNALHSREGRLYVSCDNRTICLKQDKVVRRIENRGRIKN